MTLALLWSAMVAPGAAYFAVMRYFATPMRRERRALRVASAGLKPTTRMRMSGEDVA